MDEQHLLCTSSPRRKALQPPAREWDAVRAQPSHTLRGLCSVCFWNIPSSRDEKTGETPEKVICCGGNVTSYPGGTRPGWSRATQWLSKAQEQKCQHEERPLLSAKSCLDFVQLYPIGLKFSILGAFSFPVSVPTVTARGTRSAEAGVTEHPAVCGGTVPFVRAADELSGSEFTFSSCISSSNERK